MRRLRRRREITNYTPLIVPAGILATLLSRRGLLGLLALLGLVILCLLACLEMLCCDALDDGLLADTAQAVFRVVFERAEGREGEEIVVVELRDTGGFCGGRIIYRLVSWGVVH